LQLMVINDPLGRNEHSLWDQRPLIEETLERLLQGWAV
jgi:hypothetical protein